MRFLVVLGLLATLLGAAAVAAAPEPRSAAAPADTVGTVGARPDVLEALAVLHGWDARRARAWARGDERALRALYVRRAPAARADVRLLRRYARDHLVVRRIVTQVFAAEVLRRDAAVLRLLVLDRVAGGRVLRHGVARPLGSSRPARRTVELRRVGGAWRVAAVRAVSGSGPDPRAARR